LRRGTNRPPQAAHRRLAMAHLPDGALPTGSVGASLGTGNGARAHVRDAAPLTASEDRGAQPRVPGGWLRERANGLCRAGGKPHDPPCFLRLQERRSPHSPRFS